MVLEDRKEADWLQVQLSVFLLRNQEACPAWWTAGTSSDGTWIWDTLQSIYGECTSMLYIFRTLHFQGVWVDDEDPLFSPADNYSNDSLFKGDVRSILNFQYTYHDRIDPQLFYIFRFLTLILGQNVRFSLVCGKLVESDLNFGQDINKPFFWSKVFRRAPFIYIVVASTFWSVVIMFFRCFFYRSIFLHGFFSFFL